MNYDEFLGFLKASKKPFNQKKQPKARSRVLWAKIVHVLPFCTAISNVLSMLFSIWWGSVKYKFESVNEVLIHE